MRFGLNYRVRTYAGGSWPTLCRNSRTYSANRSQSPAQIAASFALAKTEGVSRWGAKITSHVEQKQRALEIPSALFISEVQPNYLIVRNSVLFCGVIELVLIGVTRKLDRLSVLNSHLNSLIQWAGGNFCISRNAVLNRTLELIAHPTGGISCVAATSTLCCIRSFQT